MGGNSLSNIQDEIRSDYFDQDRGVRASIKWRKGSINRPGWLVAGQTHKRSWWPASDQLNSWVAGKWSAAPNSPIFGKPHFQSWLQTCQPTTDIIVTIFLGNLQRKADQVQIGVHRVLSSTYSWVGRRKRIKAELVCAACNDLLNSSAHTFIRARIWDDRIAGLRIWHPAYSAPSPCYHDTTTSLLLPIPSKSGTTRFYSQIWQRKRSRLEIRKIRIGRFSIWFDGWQALGTHHWTSRHLLKVGSWKTALAI